MKSFSTVLLDFLQTHNSVVTADLIQIHLTNGQAIAATDGQVDITAGFPPTTYFSSKWGNWSRGIITSEASFNLKANTMSLSAEATPDILFPGVNLPLLSCALNGLFDRAQVYIYRLYSSPIDPNNPQPAYDTTLPLEFLFYGEVAHAAPVDRIHVEFEVADAIYKLNLNTPPRILQSSCPWTVGDTNCGVNLSAFTDSRSAAINSTNLTIFPNTAFTFASELGTLTWTSGPNAGLSQKIRQINGDGSATMDAPFIFVPAVGNTFKASKGCDQTIATCKQFFGGAFGVHFGGMPFVPPPEVIL